MNNSKKEGIKNNKIEGRDNQINKNHVVARRKKHCMLKPIEILMYGEKIITQITKYTRMMNQEASLKILSTCNQ